MYFADKGAQNTQETVRLALDCAKSRGITNIVVASGSGDTARLFYRQPNLNVVCVTHAFGAKEPGKPRMDMAVWRELESNGIHVYTASHALSAGERGISRKHGGVYPLELIADTLRMLGHGVKVCVEIAVMALDGGLLPYGLPIIAVAGSGKGADTAVIMHPAHANAILDCKINEIICKPANF